MAAEPDAAGAAGFADAAGFAAEAAGFADTAGAAEDAAGAGAGATWCDGVGDGAGATVGSGFSGGVQIGPPFGAIAIGVAIGGFGLELQATTTPASTAELTNHGRA